MKTPEANIQFKIVKWFRNNYCLKHHNNRCAIFSVPNEAGYKNRNFTLTGMMSGVSDLIVVIPNKTLYIELKTATGKQSPKQKDFEQIIKGLKQDYYLCRSLTDFKELIKKYLT